MVTKNRKRFPKLSLCLFASTHILSLRVSLHNTQFKAVWLPSQLNSKWNDSYIIELNWNWTLFSVRMPKKKDLNPFRFGTTNADSDSISKINKFKTIQDEENFIFWQICRSCLKPARDSEKGCRVFLRFRLHSPRCKLFLGYFSKPIFYFISFFTVSNHFCRVIFALLFPLSQPNITLIDLSQEEREWGNHFGCWS